MVCGGQIRYTHVKLALVLAPAAVLADAAPLLAGHAVLVQPGIGALGVEARHLGQVRSERQIVVQLVLLRCTNVDI